MQCEGCSLFSAKDGPIYEEFYEQSKTEISDSCLNSRVAWNVGFYYQMARIEDCLCLISNGGVFTSPHLTWPVGKMDQQKLKKVVDTLWPVFANRSWPFRMMYIDEVNLSLIRDLEGYTARICHNKDYSDYVYDAESLRQLSGKSMHGKRNHINKFMRLHPDFTYNPVNANDKEESLALVKDWCDEKNLDYLNLKQSDYRAIRQLFDDFDDLDIRGGTIRVNGRLAAFALGSFIRGDTAVIHFEKADARYPGLYAVINKLTAENAFPEARFINREEDMGIRGLRRAKKSYDPVRMIHKYEVLLTRT